MAKSVQQLSAVDRAIAQALGDGLVLGREDDPAAKEFPQTWEWLRKVYVGKDRLKTPATLTIRLTPGGCLITLNDRDLAVAIDAACEHLGQALAALEAQLTGASTHVRTYGRREPSLRRRKSQS